MRTIALFSSCCKDKVVYKINKTIFQKLSMLTVNQFIILDLYYNEYGSIV